MKLPFVRTPQNAWRHISTLDANHLFVVRLFKKVAKICNFWKVANFCDRVTLPLVYKKLRFHRRFIFELAEEVLQDIEFSLPRKGSLRPVLQVCLALRFYASGSFQSVVGEPIGVDQSTA